MGEIRRPALLRNASLPELQRFVKHDLDNLDRVHRRTQILEILDCEHGEEHIIDPQWGSLPLVIPGGIAANGNRIANVSMRLVNEELAERSQLGVRVYYDADTSLVSSTVAAGSAIALTTGVAANVTSISLTPGEWETSGLVVFSGNNSATLTDASISATTATLGTLGSDRVQVPNGHTATAAYSAVLPPTPIAVAATTTYYLVARASFAGTASAYGTVQARRTSCAGLSDDVTLLLICD